MRHEGPFLQLLCCPIFLQSLCCPIPLRHKISPGTPRSYLVYIIIIYMGGNKRTECIEVPSMHSGTGSVTKLTGEVNLFLTPGYDYGISKV
uniref:Putative secreted protein n=1 Tax=Ixodes ricinus TaxID=34613 RepID=A0A6B0UCF1_IXORI